MIFDLISSSIFDDHNNNNEEQPHIIKQTNQSFDTSSTLDSTTNDYTEEEANDDGDEENEQNNNSKQNQYQQMTMYISEKDYGLKVCNQWSNPPYNQFYVRGYDYLTSHKKVASGPYIFPSRGVEIFQCTDSSNLKNIGSNTNLFQGRLRDVPTLILNFQLTFGVLIFYYEIPERFLPYLKAGDRGNDGAATKSNEGEEDQEEHTKKFNQLQEQINQMSSPSDKAVCHFLMCDDDTYRTSKFKLIPKIENGPWIVKTTVPNTPAIIGNKLPVSYIYNNKGDNTNNNNNAPYLEIDLDIGSSATAHAILSLCISYASSLTIDLGFVIQGDDNTELPEQMLIGTRIHHIDPYAAPSYPHDSSL